MKYKLIKKYPGLPSWVKEGNIIEIVFGDSYSHSTPGYLFSIPKEEVENFPEFWEKVEEKDYQIIEIKNKFSGNTLTSKNLNIEHLYNKEEWAINSVKRVSDDEIFSIGDKVRIKKLRHDGSFTISEFYFDCNNDKLLCNGECVGNGHVSINKIEKVKEPVLTTEDGVDIFEGDGYYFVDHYMLGHQIAFKGWKRWNSKNNNKRFSTKEKAEEYILMNKPCLSFKDVINYMDDPYSMIREYDKTNLIKLIKSKL